MESFIKKLTPKEKKHIITLPKTRKAIKDFSTKLKVDLCNSPQIHPRFTYSVVEHAYLAFPDGFISMNKLGKLNYDNPHFDWIGHVGNYSAIYGYKNNTEPFICFRSDKNEYAFQEIYIPNGRYYLFDSKYASDASSDSPRQFIYKERKNNYYFEFYTTPSTSNVLRFNFYVDTKSTSNNSTVTESAKDCSSAHTYLHTITDIQSKGHSIPDSLTLNMNSDTQNHNLFQVHIHECLSNGADKKFQGITYLYTSRDAYNIGELPLIIHTSEPDNQSNTFVQLSDGNYMNNINYSSITYDEIIESAKKRKIPTKLSEDVKAATSGKYQISPTIKEIYKTAIKEQRAFDSKAHQQEEH